MSSLSSVSNSSAVNYATQLAQSSALENSLYNLGSAIQGGNLTSAGTILTGIIQANPQYATNSSSSSSTSSSGSTQSQSPINQDFQNLATAIQNNDLGTAQSTWAQLKTDLANAGITNISSGAQIAAQAIAQNKVSTDETILSSLFGNGSDSNSPLSVLLDQGSSASSTDSLPAAISNWLTYQADGNAAPPPTVGAAGSNLNTVA
jgi:hypothetical protein